MKATVAFAAAFLLLGCEKSIDEQFEAMYEEQKRIAPEFAASTEQVYRYRSYATDEEKENLIRMWEDYKRIKEEGEEMGFYNESLSAEVK